MAAPFAIFAVNSKWIVRSRFTMQKALITNLRAKSCMSMHGSEKVAGGRVAFRPLKAIASEIFA